MVVPSPRCPEVGFTSNQEIIETPKPPHHSYVCIEDQYHTQIMLPPLELHDPIACAFLESYIESTCVRCKLSLFFFVWLHVIVKSMCMLSIYTQCRTIPWQVHELHVMHSRSFLFCGCIKITVCLSSLLYFSCLEVHTTLLFANHVFTNMGRPMHRWMH